MHAAAVPSSDALNVGAGPFDVRWGHRIKTAAIERRSLERFNESCALSKSCEHGLLQPSQEMSETTYTSSSVIFKRFGRLTRGVLIVLC